MFAYLCGIFVLISTIFLFLNIGDISQTIYNVIILLLSSLILNVRLYFNIWNISQIIYNVIILLIFILLFILFIIKKHMPTSVFFLLVTYLIGIIIFSILLFSATSDFVIIIFIILLTFIFTFIASFQKKQYAYKLQLILSPIFTIIGVMIVLIASTAGLSNDVDAATLAIMPFGFLLLFIFPFYIYGLNSKDTKQFYKIGKIK